MVVEISKSGGIELDPGCRDDRAGRLYVDGGERKCTSKARIRYDKYFWPDFFDRVGLTGQSPFKTFYVAEILREPVGVRREGAEIIGGPFGTYRRNLERREENEQLVDRTFSEEGVIGGFLRGRWYRNVTLHHQLGVDAEATYRHFVESPGQFDHEIGSMWDYSSG